MTRESIDARRRTVLGLLGLAGAGFAAHAAGLKAPATAPAGWPVWAIRANGATIYLLGETPPRESDWADARIAALLGGCTALWTETNQVYREPQKVLLERYAVEAAHPLSSRLNADDRDRLRTAAATCKIELADLEPYRPWCAAALLQDTYYSVSGAKGKSADRVLATQAALRIPVQSEFAAKDDVIGWFGSMTPMQDVEFLRYTLDEVLAAPGKSALIYDEWAVGNPSRATTEVERFTRLYPELATMLTTERNDRWIPRFQSMLTTGSQTMVVVGLYHMVGPHGLLALAARHGLSVRRI